MSIQEDLNEMPMPEGANQMPMPEEAMPEMQGASDSGEQLPRHLELMVGLENFFSGLPSSKIEFMRSLLQEFPSISEAIAQELRMSVDQMDDFFGAMLGEERKTMGVREQMQASPEQPVDQMQPPVNEVDRMLQAGRGQEQPLI
tara:strand:+ start:769 stop:1200 length:432 start_codon:yes stop_codon:yes gene_type:complete